MKPTFDLQLPELRTDVEDAKRDLEVSGLTRMARVLNTNELSVALDRLKAQASGEQARGLGYFDGGDPASSKPGPNQRVWNLVNKGEIFRHLVMNPTVQELIGHLLGREYLLSSLTANIAKERGLPQPLHADQQYLPVETPYAAVANCAFILSDFTNDNGATRVVPGSHLFGRYPARGESHASVAADGPAGSVLVFDGRLWHGTGVNSTECPRYAIFAYCCRPFMRQQENFSLSIAPEVLAQCSSELKARLGFRVWSALGMMGDTPYSGLHEDRPDTFVTELTP